LDSGGQMAQHPRKKLKTSNNRSDARSRRSGSVDGKTAQQIQTRIQKAQAAWETRQFDEAITCYEQALKLAPTHAGLMVDLSRAYALRYRYEDAEALVERACRLHPDDATLQIMLGRTYFLIQQFDRAIECFQQALSLDLPTSRRAETLYELTRMYERLHRLDEARAAALESLKLEPHQAVLQYLLGLIDRRAGNLPEAEQRFQNVVESTTAVSHTVADAWYQLSAISEKKGDHQQAYQRVCSAKEVLDKDAASHRYDAADIERTARKTFASTSAEHFQRWSQHREMFKPLGRGLALLTSHPRSGTTLLEQVLDSHPQLVSGDELQVMADLVYLPLCTPWPTGTPVPQIMDETPNGRIEQARQEYWRAMSGALRQDIGDRLLLDKNPALTGLLPIVARVFPEMKIVFALRDPRDVVTSCCFQQLPLNPVSVHFLTLESTAHHYAATMQTWLKFRDMIQNPWIEVRYENMVADLESEVRKVIEFLELPWDESVLEYRARAQQKHVHSPTYEAVTKPVYSTSIGRWKHYAAQLEPCLEILKPYIDKFGYRDLD
jgi:tetratricopeptide (TPR) repeat protein